MFDHSWITLERKQLSFLIGFLFSLFYVIFVYFFQLLFSACFVFTWEKKKCISKQQQYLLSCKPKSRCGQVMFEKVDRSKVVSGSISFFFNFFFNLKKKYLIGNMWALKQESRRARKKKNSKNIANGLGTPLLSETLLNYMLSLKDSAFDKIVSIKIPRISFHLL